MDRNRNGLWTLVVIAFVMSAFVISNRTVLSDAYRSHRAAAQNEERERKAILEHNSKNCYVIACQRDLNKRFGPVIRMEEANYNETRLYLAGGAVTDVCVQETQNCR